MNTCRGSQAVRHQGTETLRPCLMQSANTRGRKYTCNRTTIKTCLTSPERRVVSEELFHDVPLAGLEAVLQYRDH